MEHVINAHEVLRAFDRISRDGKQQGGEFHLDGVVATAGHDGYDITLSNGTVSLTLMFHHKYQLDSPGDEELQHFLHHLTELADKEKG
ncbi:DUF3081 family protein [Ferrimonas marina]|uniref:DUF3081 domain-containing protein n=1 Tax=Ferrimonas marina TaxID=299255 RepID=A0A1M5YVL6_9GAMM|nr:DUF3081 family protein [Ferrimonas marina]SHI16137.1 Protein of unknown function [Ferrimonas marina]